MLKGSVPQGVSHEDWLPEGIKPQEFRVGMTPDAAREAVAHGHKVMIEKNAGVGAGFTDADYKAAGAKIVDTAEEVFEKSDMIVKVKEPQHVERKRLREGQVLFTYLHLAPDPAQTKDLLKSGATCIAYETVTDDRGGLPLLAPMSEVAGRLAHRWVPGPAEGERRARRASGRRAGRAAGQGAGHRRGVVGTHAARLPPGWGRMSLSSTGRSTGCAIWMTCSAGSSRTPMQVLATPSP